jgi:hypothetical protein
MKESVYYFNKLNDTGEPDFAGGPQVLINNVGVIDITTDPRTGIIYMVDLIFKRSLRIYNAGAAALPVAVIPDASSVSFSPVNLKQVLLLCVATLMLLLREAVRIVRAVCRMHSYFGIHAIVTKMKSTTKQDTQQRCTTFTQC